MNYKDAEQVSSLVRQRHGIVCALARLRRPTYIGSELPLRVDIAGDPDGPPLWASRHALVRMLEAEEGRVLERLEQLGVER